jgi:hypothetical protein
LRAPPACALQWLLFDRRAIDVVIIVTRATEKIFGKLGKGASYGAATTHHEKLVPRLDGGGGGCPILAFAITGKLYVEDEVRP